MGRTADVVVVMLVMEHMVKIPLPLLHPVLVVLGLMQTVAMEVMSMHPVVVMLMMENMVEIPLPLQHPMAVVLLLMQAMAMEVLLVRMRRRSCPR